MRTGGIIRIVVGLVIAALLTAFLVAALTGFNLFEKLGWNTGWTSWLHGNSISTVDDGSTVVSETAAVDAAGVNEIKIDWVAGSVEIRVGEGDQITFYETANRTLTDAQKMRYTLSSGGVLQIKYSADVEDVFDWLDSDTYNMPAKALIVTVPASMIGTLGTLDIDAVSAKVDVDGVYGGETKLNTVSGAIAAANIACEELKLSSTSGSVKAEACQAEKLDLGNVSGSLRAEGVYAQIDAESVSGEVRLSCSSAPDKITAESVSGSVTVQLPESAGFTAKLDSVSGGLSCTFPGTLSDKMVVVGDGSANYRFNTVSGSIRIEQYE